MEWLSEGRLAARLPAEGSVRSALEEGAGEEFCEPQFRGERGRGFGRAELDGMAERGEAGFLAGAALAALNPIARAEHPLGGLWRQRLALANQAVLARQGGRTEDAAALRDAWYLRRDGDDPGPGAASSKPGDASARPAPCKPTVWTPPTRGLCSNCAATTRSKRSSRAPRQPRQRAGERRRRRRRDRGGEPALAARRRNAGRCGSPTPCSRIA